MERINLANKKFIYTNYTGRLFSILYSGKNLETGKMAREAWEILLNCESAPDSILYQKISNFSGLIEKSYSELNEYYDDKDYFSQPVFSLSENLKNRLGALNNSWGESINGVSDDLVYLLLNYSKNIYDSNKQSSEDILNLYKLNEEIEIAYSKIEKSKINKELKSAANDILSISYHTNEEYRLLGHHNFQEKLIEIGNIFHEHRELLKKGYKSLEKYGFWKILEKLILLWTAIEKISPLLQNISSFLQLRQ